MIIQALHQRYHDLLADPDSEVSPLYFSLGKVTYVCDLTVDGNLQSFRDIRDESGKRKQPVRFIVPEQSSRSSGVVPYFVSDKAEYALGHYPVMSNEAATLKKRADARKKYEAAKALALDVLADVDDEAARALLLFYEQWDLALVRDHPLLQPYMEDLDKGIDTNVIFAFDMVPIHESPAVRSAWIQYREQSNTASEFDGQCLLTGDADVSIARTHDKIKGVRGAQSAGASLVSFNFRSADSYDKEQSYNSPVSKAAVFSYTTALNHLLASDTNRKLIGDMTVVFWAATRSAEESTSPFVQQVFQSTSTPQEDTRTTALLGDLLDRVRQGRQLNPNSIPNQDIPFGDTPFYILGLSPNNARIAVRFFWQGSFGDLVRKLALHAYDMALPAQTSGYRENPSIDRIVAETMRVGADGKKVGEEPPKRLGGELLRGVLQGTVYPRSIFLMIINRIRADGLITHLRVSILKAYLNRYNRFHTDSKEEMPLSLDTNENQNPAYRLGQLFAVLEKAQQEAASGKLNATIKDRYFSSASSNPGAVFPILIKLAQHHMSKARYGELRDREIAGIMQQVNGFPVRLDVHQQGIFILGYYHQKQAYIAQIKAATEAKQEAAGALNAEESEE
ncbi:type I-C CRISPR-associated protein Cas8c/Csd1 [Paenibacillus sp. IB182496]|uniref:Type I-C CRISPR-associated protein Cas8c/Csd1 n=1 Tax=Paenibacillus sabuli TaxID=2772509 RepID=A0A927BTA0_9BACL|nr:type I-C CRISPR-associated protein Cas8c/Csd1 [Paenibacillus sabuli]MBD2846386.1 type I-C CRISPR-associated protein Cas8c/Csd1 [Paenibacillus sabuli]